MTRPAPVAAALVGCVLSFAPAADPDRAARFQAVVDAAAADLKENAVQRDKLLVAQKAIEADKVAKLWPLVEADPADETAYKVCALCCGSIGRLPAVKPETRKAALDVLRKHHLGRPELVRLFPALATDPDGRAFLRAVLDGPADRSTRAQACYELAVGAAAPWWRMGLMTSAPAGVEIPRRETDEYLARLTKEFSDEPYPRRKVTLAEVARGIALAEDMLPGRQAPAAECSDLNGSPATLAGLKGKVVVLDFWTTWCKPCKAMIPHQRTLVERLRDKPFALVSVSADDEKEKLTEFLKETPMPWTH